MPHKIMSADTWSLRQQVLRKYGSMCLCACGCRTTNLSLLQLHHANHNGTKERESVRGKNLYIKLMAEPVDADLHPLCVSCHWQESMFGACPNPLLSAENEKVPGVRLTGGEASQDNTPTVQDRAPAPLVDPYAVLTQPLAVEPPTPLVTPPKPSLLRRVWRARP